MSVINDLEKTLTGVFVDKAPALPAGVKKFLVTYLPWINLILGVLTLLAALALWNWAHVANNLVNYANTLSRAYGGSDVVSNRLTAGIWVGLLVLVIEAVLYIAAFPGTRDKKKTGWNLLFYALIVNVVYDIVLLFTSYGGGISNLIGGVVGTAIGLYFLFQIRASYN